ncbi:MAG: hypothetical protein IKR54_02805 [Lachnospiraceae bacterium]|nr:hypothetical protein [Lachnospiraceae bacterium]
MALVTYSGVRESKPGRVNDLGTTGREVSEEFKKDVLKEQTAASRRDCSASR